MRSYFSPPVEAVAFVGAEAFCAHAECATKARQRSWARAEQLAPLLQLQPPESRVMGAA